MKKTLRFKMSILFVLFSLVLCLSLSIFSHFTAWESYSDIYYDKAFSAAEMTASLVDGNRIGSYLETMETDDYYDELLEIMNNIKRSFDILYLYIFEPGSDSFTFIIEAVLETDDPEMMSDMGEVFEYTSIEYKYLVPDIEAERASSRKVLTNDEDGYGRVVSAWVPIFNDEGKMVAMAEADIAMEKIEERHFSFLITIVLLSFGITALLVVALLLLTRRMIINPLMKLTNNARAFSRGSKISQFTDIIETGDEIQELSESLVKMSEELQIQFDYINGLHASSISFVPVQFMESLGVADITKMKLGDNIQREMTILFFDIRGFSLNSEMMTARENFVFINKVLGITGPIIRKHNGFIDKYIGDAAMALFNDAHDAVRAGIELYQKIVLDKDTSVKIGVDGINIGVGIHSGSVMMGIIGENERLSSTVISSNVNLASRVESLSKQTGSGMLITRDTMNQLSGKEEEFTFRFIGMVRAAGVNEVVGLFDILDALPRRDKKLRLATQKIFESGVRKFHSKEYEAAVQRFQKVVDTDPNDICAWHHLIDAKNHLEDKNLPSVFIFDKK